MKLLILMSVSASAKDWTTLPPGTASPRVLLREAQKAHPPQEGEDEDEAMEGRDYVHILYEGSYIAFDDQGRQTLTFHRVYELASQDAVASWGRTEAGWSPWFQDRPQINARVIAPNGKVFTLDPETLTEAGAQTGDLLLYTEDKLIEGPLPGVDRGAVVEEWITWTEHRPFMESGVMGRTYLSSQLPIDKVRLTLSAPEDQAFNWKPELLEGVEVIERRDGTLEFVFEDVEPYEDYEPGQPLDQPLAPAIAWSIGGDWGDYAAEYLSMSSGRIDPTGLEKAVRKAQDGEPDTLGLINNLLDWMREEVRYTGLEFGESSIVPYTPQQTLERGYGDCKDKATLLISALQLAGVEAHFALLYAGGARDVDPELPGSNQFNHAIVYVPELDLFVDPTSAWTGAGFIPESDQGRWALVAAPGVTELKQIPRATPASAHWEETTVWEMGLNTATVRETVTASGYLATGPRRYYSERSEDETRKELKEARDSWQVDEDAGGWELPGLADAEAPFQYVAEWPKAGAVTPDPDEFSVPLGGDSVLEFLPQYALFDVTRMRREARERDEGVELPKRRTAMQIPPSQATTVERVRVPAGFVMPELPDDLELEAGPVRLSATYTETDGWFTATFHLDTGDGNLSPDEVIALWEAVEVYSRAVPASMEFLGLIPQGLEDGELSERGQELQALIAENPESAGFQLMLAQAWMRMGQQPAALEAATRATELEPENLEAWRTLARMTQANSLGLGGVPYDRDAVLAAVEMGLTLDPEDTHLLNWKARLLCTGSDGVPWGEGSDLDQALATYDALEEVLDQPGRLDYKRHEIYWRQGDFQAWLDESEPPYTSARDIAALAATKGSRAAMQEVKRLGMEPDRQKDFVRRVAWELTLHREHELVRDVWEEGQGKAGKKDPLARRKASDPFKNMQSWEQHVEDAQGEPQGAVMAYMAHATIHPELPFPGELVSPALADYAELDDPHYKLMEQLEWAPIAAYTDFTLSGLEFETTGDQSTGWRVQGLFDGEPQTTPYYVLSEGGGLQVAGYPGGWPVIAQQIQIFHEQDQLPAARAWLDWMLEDLGGPASGDTPMEGSAYRHYWRSERPDSDIPIAAALILAGDEKTRDQGLPVLIAAVQEVEDEGDRLQISRILAYAASADEQWEQALSASEVLVAHSPKNARANQLKARALAGLGRHDEAIAMADALSTETGGEDWAVDLRASTRIQAGDFEQAIAIRQEANQGKKATRSGLNNLAWSMAVEGSDLDEALDLAIRANTWDDDKYLSELHTLAVIYGLMGDTALEHATLELALQRVSTAEQLGEHWNLVFGDLALALGDTERARQLYSDVEENLDPTSTWQLTQRALKALDD